jgi:hypothetical protein
MNELLHAAALMLHQPFHNFQTQWLKGIELRKLDIFGEEKLKQLLPVAEFGLLAGSHLKYCWKDLGVE